MVLTTNMLPYLRRAKGSCSPCRHMGTSYTAYMGLRYGAPVMPRVPTVKECWLGI